MLPEGMPRFAGVTKLSQGGKDLGDPKNYPIVVSLFSLLRRALIPSFSLNDFFSFLYSAKCRFLSALHFASILHPAALVIDTPKTDVYTKQGAYEFESCKCFKDIEIYRAENCYRKEP